MVGEADSLLAGADLLGLHFGFKLFFPESLSTSWGYHNHIWLQGQILILYDFPVQTMLPEGLHAWWWPSHCHELWRTKGRMYMNVVRKSRQLRKIFWEILMRCDKHVAISKPYHSVLSEIHGYWKLWKRTRKIVENLLTSSWQHCFSLHSSCPALRRCVRSGLISNGWSHGKGRQLGAQMSEFGTTSGACR